MTEYVGRVRREMSERMRRCETQRLHGSMKHNQPFLDFVHRFRFLGADSDPYPDSDTMVRRWEEKLSALGVEFDDTGVLVLLDEKQTKTFLWLTPERRNQADLDRAFREAVRTQNAVVVVFRAHDDEDVCVVRPDATVQGNCVFHATPHGFTLTRPLCRTPRA